MASKSSIDEGSSKKGERGGGNVVIAHTLSIFLDATLAPTRGTSFNGYSTVEYSILVEIWQQMAIDG